ncbi:alkylated DNA repair protein alkB homolog 8 isoform X1 [Sesamum indicum]|uniref:Alkylated DNA repair protein alkB homolog 8 isoform X1 n=1 Tax=Sesamum indicum TaxID=4182 RepID=A0A6I9TGY2_SESIN|nr:alkylated DNA repair protein alkB homolog 8 isoform X1 [Sesamum indicum]XP_011082164.1 alkylated DNA repair protein alkB homolog 8 isoform X1 [Sesamum indicum]
MGLPRFTCPKGGDGESSPHLYVANCGPAVGLSYDTIASVFGTYGEVKGVCAADESGTRVIVSYHDKSSAQDAMKALNRHPCSSLGGRLLHIQYSVQSLGKVNNTDSVPVSTSASGLDIPGLYLMHDFVTPQEEQELLAAVDDRAWQHLAKRRVQHYGYEFCYDIRTVNTNHYLGELPSFVSPILERIRTFQTLDHSADIALDQLTVNEYPPGVGLSPHIDTHSAFEDLIFSLSLAGPCIMEFRKYATAVWQEKSTSSSDVGEQISEKNSSFVRKAIYLPPRSMLLLSGEARYVWHHYIPHHKVDKVNDSLIRRGSRRVSFTLRKENLLLVSYWFTGIGRLQHPILF